MCLLGSPGPARPRGRRGDEADDDRERERLVEAVAEGAGDQPARRSCGPRCAAAFAAERWERTCGPDQRRRRVVAEEGGEEHRDRRELRRRGLPWCGATPCASSPALSVWGRVAESPMIISVKKIADREHLRGVLERLVHAGAGAAVARRAGCSSRRPGSARRRRPSRGPSGRGAKANSRVGEVEWQALEQHEPERRPDHPAGREHPRAVAVGEETRTSGRRAGTRS